MGYHDLIDTYCSHYAVCVIHYISDPTHIHFSGPWPIVHWFSTLTTFLLTQNAWVSFGLVLALKFARIGTVALLFWWKPSFLSQYAVFYETWTADYLGQWVDVVVITQAIFIALLATYLGSFPLLIRNPYSMRSRLAYMVDSVKEMEKCAKIEASAWLYFTTRMKYYAFIYAIEYLSPLILQGFVSDNIALWMHFVFQSCLIGLFFATSYSNEVEKKNIWRGNRLLHAIFCFVWWIFLILATASIAVFHATNPQFVLIVLDSVLLVFLSGFATAKAFLISF